MAPLQPPQGAIFEGELSPHVVLFDVSALLPKGAGEYKTRSVPGIDRLFVHKSGADGKPGFVGAYAMAQYTTSLKGRNWPGAPYHFWISREPDVTVGGSYVVYRCQPDNVWSHHSGKHANERGVAAALQGNYDSEWDLLASGRPRIQREPSDAQVTCLEALVDWAIDHYKLKLPEGLSGHWEAPHPKKVCPGDFLRQWVLDRRATNGRALTPVETDAPESLPHVEPWEVNVTKPSVETLQKALSLVGFDPGSIDGIWGHRSRAALEAFQSVHGLEPDGWYGPQTATMLLEALRIAGVSRAEFFHRIGPKRVAT